MASNPVKFGLNYSLRIQNATGTSITIAMPFTLEFDCIRNNYASTNTARIRVFNLSPEFRNFLLHDQYDFSVDHALYVVLQAGYGSGPLWPVIFKGNVTRGYSQREGTSFITTLEAFDGGLAYANARSHIQWPSGTLQLATVKALVDDLAPYGVSLGAVSAALGGILMKGGSYSGNTLTLLADLTNGNYFIDNLAINFLTPGDAINGTPLLLDPSAGLLETPLKESQFLEMDMLFEPRVTIGTLVDLQAGTQQAYNGIHQCISIHHRGTISAAVLSDATTRIGLQAGTFTRIAARAGI